MSITLELPQDIQKDLEQAAKQAGLTPDAYVLATLREQLPKSSALGQTQGRSQSQLSKREAELLQSINQSLSQIQWQRYHELLAKRQAEQIIEEERLELVSLSNQLEEANAKRIGYLAELAQLRHTSLDKLMSELGLTPATHA
jgi:hypothetical protein